MELHFNPFLVEKESLRLGQVMEMLNKQSGVLGISGLSSDFRDLIAASEEGNDRARLAIDLFVYSVAKGIGSLVPALGGLEVLVFTAGIRREFAADKGENMLLSGIPGYCSRL